MLRSSMMLLVVLSACGPQTISPAPAPGRVGLQPDATYFWQVQRSTIEWGDCSDAPDFRASASALPFGMNSFFIYKTDAKGTTATTQNCPEINAASCMPSNSGLVFDVFPGPELEEERSPVTEPLRVRDQNGAVRDSTCSLTQVEKWVFRDQGLTFDLEINTALSVTEQTGMECKLIEDDLKARSPNGLGITGCVITFRLGGALR
jgi:hypothetical protein